MAKDKLYGQEATMVQVLNKIEIAARRAAMVSEAGQQMVRFAEELAKLEKEIWNG